MNTKRYLAAAMAGVLLLAGCGGRKETQSKVSDADLKSYPLKGGITFTFWKQLNPNLAATYSNQGESPFEKELEKRTGVKIKYQHPAAGSVQESFNIMISSGDLPDLIYYPWEWYQGGAVKAIEDGHIITLTDKMEKYAPAYTSYLKEHEDIDRAVRTESGDYFGFPFIKGDSILCTSAGLMIRKDMLDELGLEAPETMDEMYEVLTAIKKSGKVDFPYSGDLYLAALWGLFSSAYNVLPELYVDGSEVKFGAGHKEYKEFLTTMNKWYKEGLIDNGFATLDAKTIDSNMINGYAAMTNGAGGSGMGVYITTAKKKNPKYDLVALKTPVLKKGTRPMFGNYSPQVSGHYTAITKACKNVEAAMKYLDYLYTDEGHMLANFGIEGVSYEMKNGEPVYTDFILKNKDGKSPSDMMAQYMLSSGTGGGSVVDKRYITQYYQLDRQRDALEKWSDNDAAEHEMPMLHIDAKDLSTVSRQLTDLQTYTQTMTLKFIMGTESLDNYDKFVEDLKKMGMDNVEKAYTKALAAYYKK